MTITVVSPHRGDAAFSLGLAVEAWLAQGHAIEVVSCFTRSEFAPYSDADSVHANDRMSFVTAVRRREDEAWRKQYGAAKLTLTDLNLKDAPARLHCGPEQVFRRAPDVSEKVASKIRRALELSSPGATVLPLGLSGHVDHVTARDLAMSVQKAALPLAFYEELPYSAAAGEESIEDAVKQLSAALRIDLQPTFASGPHAHAAMEEAVLRKRRLALCYDSQIDECVTSEIANFSRSYLGRERLWANAAWRADLALTPPAI